MSTLYKFNISAYWERPGEGPLITPHFHKPKSGTGKEKTFGNGFVEYLEDINTERAFKHIASPTFGPSRGLRYKYKKKVLISRSIRLVMAVYPGYDNLVMIKEVKGGWGVIEGFDEDKIPSKAITHETHPWLIHKVYGSNRKMTPVILKDEIFVPVMSDHRYIQMKWLEKA